MAIKITKLDSPLPKVVFPTTLSNGAASPVSSDPYLEGNGSVWNNNAATIKAIKTSGFRSGLTGQLAGTILRQNIAFGSSPLKIYIELKNYNIPLRITPLGSFETGIIPTNGAFIIDIDVGALLVTDFRMSTIDPFYTADPYFKNVKVGVLPADTTVSSPSWCCINTSTKPEKNNDGRIYMTHGPAGSVLLHKNSLPFNTPVELTIVVDKVAPGETLFVGPYGSGPSLSITAPGIYKLRSAIWSDATRPLAINSSVPTLNPIKSIISYFQVKASSYATQSTPDETIMSAEAFFIAQASFFNEVFKPSSYVATNQYSLGGSRTPEPLIGYSAYLPPAGQYWRGDIIRNTQLASGQPTGWRCVTSGNPGTWVALPSNP